MKTMNSADKKFVKSLEEYLGSDGTDRLKNEANTLKMYFESYLKQGGDGQRQF